MTDRSGSFSPGPGAGNGRNTNGEAGPEGSAFSGSAALVENAIVSLAIAARIAGIPADPESLCRAFPSREPSAIPLILLRAAKALGLKAKRMFIWQAALPPSLCTVENMDLSADLPADARVSADLHWAPSTREISLLVRTDADGETGYSLRLEPGAAVDRKSVV